MTCRLSAQRRCHRGPLGYRGIVLCLLILAVGPALAQTWDGSSNTNWGTGANWNTNSVPSYGATVNFDNTPGSNQTINVGSSRQIAEANVNSTYDYILNSGSLVFVTGSRALNYSGTGNLTVNSGLIGSGGQVQLNNNSTGTMTINGNLSSWSSTSFHYSGSGTTIQNGSIGGGIPIAISGTGNRTFNTNITTAGLTIEGGTNTFNNSLAGGTITISGGDNTFNSNIGSATMNISGGTNFFDGSFGGGTEFNLTGGDAVVTDGFGGGADISVNVASGGLSITGAIGGGANIDVTSGQLALSGTVGTSQIVIQSGGTLLLEDGADLSAGGSNVEMNGGTLAVTADSVIINSLTLNEDSVIDLLDDPDANIYLGTVNGDGVMQILNYQDTQQVTFDSTTSTNAGFVVAEQVLFGNTPGMVDPNNPDRIIPGVTPVPEPGTIVAGSLLSLLLAGHCLRRRWKNRRTEIAVENKTSS